MEYLHVVYTHTKGDYEPSSKHMYVDCNQRNTEQTYSVLVEREKEGGRKTEGERGG